MDTVLVAYVPVLHQGYLTLFRKYAGVLYLVTPDLVDVPFPRLHRDLRQMSAEDISHAILGLDIFKEVNVLTEANAQALDAGGTPIVMPRDELSDWLAEHHFPSCEVTYENVFLRWDKPITEAETVVAPDHIISTSDIDVELMNRAAQEAERSGDWWRPIGGLATRDGEILFTGFNCHHPSEHTVYAFGNPRDNFDAGERLDITPTLHTEQAMIARAARILLEGASVYVTTFPCITCARLLAEAGVMKVYYRDGYSRQDAEGELRDHGIEIILVQDAD